MARRNGDVALLLEGIAKLLALKGEEYYRIRAYEEAARSISSAPQDIVQLHSAGHLRDIPGVGPAIAAKIGEYLDTGRLRYYDDLKRQVHPEAADLLEVPGLGPARARALHDELDISMIPELQQAAREHRIHSLPGFGEKLEQDIAREATRVAQRTHRLLLGTALPAAEEMVRLLHDHPAIQEIDPVGSIRRMRETIGDIEILVATDQPEAVMDAFISLPVVEQVIAKGPSRSSILTTTDLQIDLRAVAPDGYGVALQYFTGSKDHNIALRSVVVERGSERYERRLIARSGRPAAAGSEAEIYHALGLDWIPPELRENRGELEAAARHTLPELVELEQIQGDLHVHTDWSDGTDSLERMIEIARARRYHYVAITDHSQSLHVAHGLSADRVREQRQLIDSMNKTFAPFRILHGAEVDILPDGSLDYPDALLGVFDIVTASVHSAFKQPREQMTARIMRALSNPHVDVLNHPTGRLLERRPEYEVDVEAVLQAAAKYGVAVEVNGQPDRLDLDDTWSRRAKELGVMLALNSDAHSDRQLENVRYAVAAARRGWIEPRNVLNALPLDQFLAHLGHQKQRVRSA